MQKLRVFYSPTQSNRLLVPKLAGFGRLKDCAFVELPEFEHKRNRALGAIRGKAAFIWGDGHHHEESYFFTKPRKIKLKINVDYHTDDLGSQGIDCGNHMAKSKKQGKKIVVSDVAKERIVLGKFCNNEKRLDRFMNRAERRGLRFFEDEVAMTVDCDAIYCFPALGKWVFPDALFADAVVGLIRELGPRTFRLDIGGLVEKIPEFDLMNVTTEQMRVVASDVYGYLRRTRETGEENRVWLPQYTDLVLSYATWVYASVLEAFLLHSAV